MTDDALYADIQADPAAKALADAGRDADCAARLAAVLPPVAGRYIPVRTLIYFGAVGGVRARMQAAGADANSPIQSLAISYMDMIRDANSPGLDLADPAIAGGGGLLDAFAQAGVFSDSGAGSVGHLLSLAPAAPAAVDHSQVSRAMERDRPDGRIPNQG
jgi:hypothetical protein